MDCKQINNDINKKIFARNVPSNTLEIQLSSRSKSTKYDLNPSKNTDYSDNQTYLNYNIEHTFNPGNSKGPLSGYATRVNDESILKNQIHSLQRSPQGVWVPESTSDLYQNKMVEKKSDLLVFKKDNFNDFNPDSNKLQKSYWNNHTRNELFDVRN